MHRGGGDTEYCCSCFFFALLTVAAPQDREQSAQQENREHATELHDPHRHDGVAPALGVVVVAKQNQAFGGGDRAALRRFEPFTSKILQRAESS